MRHLTHLIPLICLGLLSLGLAGCGGGGGGGLPDASAFSTKTSGNVTALNGQSADVDGVELACPATGGRSISDLAGRFDLGDLPAEIVDITIRTPGNGKLIVVKVDLRGGGEVVIRIAVDDDGIRRVSLERCGRDRRDNETRARLMAVETGLEGKVEIEKDADGDQKFEVEVENLVPGRTIEVFVVDASDVEQSQGIASANALGEAELELETGDGDSLPLGVTDVSALEGRRVVVRDATSSDELMRGEIPALGRVPAPCREHDGRDDDDDDDDDDDENHREGRARLRNAAGVLGEARAKLRSRPERGEEKLEVEVERTNVTDPIELWLEDPANAGSFVLIGTLVLDDDEPELELELDTSDGDVLPFGVTGVAELVGLAVELRSGADGSVLFTGALPRLNPS